MSRQLSDSGNIIPYRRADVVGGDDLSNIDLVQRVRRHAVDRPNHKAVAFGSEILTYRELIAAVDRLANRLREKGIGRQDRIALCAAPDVYVPVALLAIIELDAVYVPIGSDYPRARVRTVVDDVRPTMVLTTGDAEALFADLAIRVEDLTVLCAPLAAQPIPPTPSKTTDADEAYIFYTSGTTGTPKGIAIGHGGLRFYVRSAIEAYGIGPEDVVLSIARYSFSISLFELLSPLVAGGTLQLLGRDQVMNAAELTKALQQATVAHIGPSLLGRTLDYIEAAGIKPNTFEGLRHISSGGDVVRPDLLERMKRAFSHAEIYVIYGCTEIACMGCSYFARRDEVVEKTYVGKPFAGAEILLLDDDRPAAPGERGEVLFAGPGLLNGYINKPHLTEKKRAVIDGKVYFRTGDIGRLTPSGDLELLGRQDFQIKIRSLRIEPVEVEVHLRRVPGIHDAVVTAAEGRKDNRQLVAYLVTDPENCPSIPDIRARLSEHLPDYMIPTLYALLDRLPLNHNLELDRNALPAPETCRLLTLDEQVSLRTDTEARLVNIWRAELGKDAIGSTSDFFDLGGDSLIAVTLCLVMSEAFGVPIRPTDLCGTSRTIGALAKLIDDRRAAGSGAEADDEAARKRTTEDRPMPILPPAARFLKDRHSINLHRWNIAQLLESKSPLNPERVQEAVIAVARRHDSLDMRLSEDWAHWYSLPEAEAGDGMFGHVDLAAIPDHDLPQAIADLVEREQAGLDLQNGPVTRIVHIDLGPNRPHRLLVIAHHLAADGTSWPVLVRDLVWAYEHLVGHRPTPLVGRTGSYRAWGQAVLAMGRDADICAQLDHWTDRPWQAVDSLPRTGSGPNTNQSARSVEVHLSQAETEQLRNLLPRGASATELLIPTLARTIAKWVGSDWVLIDSLEDGRVVPNVDMAFTQSVGFMGFYVPLLLQAGEPGGKSLKVLGAEVRKARKVGYAHDALRYLADDPEVSESMSALPRAQVMFNYGRNMRSFLPDDTLFEEADESAGDTHSPLNARDYEIGAVADRVRGELTLKLVYSRNLHDKATIQALLDNWSEGLRSLLH